MSPPASSASIPALLAGCLSLALAAPTADPAAGPATDPATGPATRPAAGPASPRDDSAAFDALPGTWSAVKDGLGLTLVVEPVLGGAAYQTWSLTDDGNRVTRTGLLSFDPRSGEWMDTNLTNTGFRSTDKGRVEGDAVVLYQTGLGGERRDPVTARLVYRFEGPDRFVLDWQSPGADGGWTPRPEPFVYERVERPAVPAAPGRIAFISHRDDNWDIYTMNPDGSDVRPATRDPAGDHAPRWIAGGRRLAFLSQRGRDDGGWERWEVDPDGTDVARVPLPERLGNPGLGDFPEVHPSGSWCVYAAEVEGDLELFVCRFDGGGAKALAPAPGRDARPLWSPDGSRVLFESERDGKPELYVVGADGERLTRLTDNDANDRYARWSPDGNTIVFASDRDTPGMLELYAMTADGEHVRRLTVNEVEDGEPSWSPDGRHIVYRSDVFGNSEICVLEVASGAVTNISNNEAYDAEPVWSPVRSPPVR